MSTILEQIIAETRKTVVRSRGEVPEAVLERRIATRSPVRDFLAALQGPNGPKIIAEVKKASPSAGVIRDDFDPVAIARIYQNHGAACISVLTDAPFFQGDLAYLRAIREAVSVPLLRKDFIIDRYQLLEARDAGADCVLLIAEILPGAELARLYQEARALGLQALIELHDAEQLPRVLETGTPLIGINNRDLRTFHTRLEHTLSLLDRIPSERTVVSESGIRDYADLQRLQAAGVKAVLVGESLMRSPNIATALRALQGLPG